MCPVPSATCRPPRTVTCWTSATWPCRTACPQACASCRCAPAPPAPPRRRARSAPAAPGRSPSAARGQDAEAVAQAGWGRDAGAAAARAADGGVVADDQLAAAQPPHEQLLHEGLRLDRRELRREVDDHGVVHALLRQQLEAVLEGEDVQRRLAAQHGPRGRPEGDAGGPPAGPPRRVAQAPPGGPLPEG